MGMGTNDWNHGGWNSLGVRVLRPGVASTRLKAKIEEGMNARSNKEYNSEAIILVKPHKIL